MKKQIAVMVCLTGLLAIVTGCNETHAQKKKAMVEQWEKSTAAAQLPAIENLLDQGQIKKAKEQLIHCIDTNPDMAGAYVLIGRIHFIEAGNDQARQAFEQAVQLDPYLCQAWNFLGSLSVVEKDYPTAIEHFQKAHDLEPAEEKYILSLADVYVQTSQYERAYRIIDEGISVHPESLELLLSKAQIYQQMDQTDEAIRIYEQAQLLHGDKSQILEASGYAYITQQKWTKAAEKFDLLLAHYEKDDERYNVTIRSLATCLYHSGQYGKALYWYDKLSLVYRDDADIWFNMAQASLNLDDAKRAAYCAIKALKINPAWSEAYAVLGSARYIQGLYEQSLQAFYKISSDDSLGAFAWFMTGRCYQRLGQNRQANAAFERAEKLDPKNELIAAFLKKTVHPL